MDLDADRCYRALRARDRRFDGTFFVAVETTGIYCRPICPARTPSRRACRFFGSAAEAERQGFRACFRCRPERAPGDATTDALPRLVRRAAARIEAGYLDEKSLDDLAAECGVGARHLRRAMEAELGVTPIELAQTRRLALAKQLLQDTTLPVSDVAFAAGFRSLRRFNASFRARFDRAPTVVRRASRPDDGAGITLRLEHRPPLDFARLLDFLRARAIPGVEHVSDDTYARAIAIDGHEGTLTVRKGGEHALLATVSIGLAARLPDLVQRMRNVFDLDARPDVVRDHLAADRRLARLVRARPGVRVPGAFDGFELAVRAVLGQQVSVRAATTLAGRLVATFGAPLRAPSDRLTHRFPTAASLARARPDALRAIGLMPARADTILALARAVCAGRVRLDPGGDPDFVARALVALPGIGPWTASYVAMRALRWPDACPAGDLALKKALGAKTAREVEQRTRAWSPWRAYGVMHAWIGIAEGDLP